MGSTRCYPLRKEIPLKSPQRLFRTSWFTKAAKKAGISDAQLRSAWLQILQGQASDLGGGVFKKRLNKNEHRSILLAKAGRIWVYEYLFAKKDRANITAQELAAFRKLAAQYAELNQRQIDQLVSGKFWMEIEIEDES